MIDEKFIQNQKSKIEEAITKLSKRLKSSENFTEIGSSSEDSVLEFEAFEEKLALNKGVEKDLVLLKSALKKIEEGKYGFCQKCGEAIEKGRLETYPEAEFCSTHAKRS